MIKPQSGHRAGAILTFCFDIDGTICTQTRGDYQLAIPHLSRIEAVNQLYRDGHTVKLFTARGSKSGLDWRSVTEEQMAKWGVLHHELIMGKPHADLFVDDKACHSDDFDWVASLKSGSNNEK